MKKLALMVLFLLFAQIISAQVVIKEVLYDPVDSETTGEAVLLYNEGSSSVDVSDWVLATESSSTDATLPQGMSISPGGYLLIADSGFSLNKYNSSWPDADYEEAISLSNSDAGVALKNGDVIVDAVGWGNPLNIEEGLYEGTPHLGTIEGESLRRDADTNDNSIDLHTTTPIFYTTQPEYNPLELVLNLEVNITSVLEILSLKILADDNSSKEGVQIIPVLDDTKTFEVRMEVYDPNNGTGITNAKIVVEGNEYLMEKVDINGTNFYYLGNASMQYYEEARTYELTGEILNDGDILSENTFFEYEEKGGMTSSENLGVEMKAGNTSIETFTIRNIGNKDLQLQIKSVDLVSGSNILPVERIEASIDNFVTNTVMSETYQSITSLPRNSEQEIKLRISSDENDAVGSYQGQVFVLGE